MPRILESDAIALARNIDSMPEDQRPQAASILQAYKEQQEADGLPHWPQLMADQERETKRFRSMFESLSNVDGVAPAIAPVVKFAADPDSERARVANIAFLSMHYRKPPEEMANSYELYRNDYAAQNWDHYDPIDDKGFHAKAADEIRAQVDTETMTNEARHDAALAALDGDNVTQSLSAWQSQAEKKSGYKPSMSKDYLDAHAKIARVIAPRRDRINGFVNALQREMQGKAKDSDKASMQAFKDELLDMPKGDARLILNAMAAKASKAGEGQDMGILRSMGEGLARFVTADTSFSENGLAEVPESPGFVSTRISNITSPAEARAFVEEQASHNSSQAFAAISSSGTAGMPRIAPAGPERRLSEDEAALVKEAKARAQKAIDMGREIRQMAHSTDPVGAISGSIGTSLGIMAATIGTGGAALPVVAQLYTASNYEQLRLEHPDINPMAARKIALVSGAAEAALDALDIKILGRMPNVASLLRGGWKRGLVASSRNLGEALVAENLQEAAQDSILPLVTALSSDAPSVNWRQDLYEYAAGRADVAVSLLPLILVGSGIATVHEIKAANKEWLNEQSLRAAGFTEKDRSMIHDAADTGNPEVLQSALQDAWGRRSPEIAAEYRAQNDELQKAKEEFAAATNTEAEAQVLSITHDESGWRLNMADGGTVRVDSAQAAVSLRSDLMQARTEDEARALVSVVEDWQKNAPADTKRETNFTGEQVRLGSDGQLIGERAGGDVRVIDSPKLLQDIRSQAQSTGLGAEIDLVVNGSNHVFAQSVNEASRQIIQRLEINRSDEQPQIITVLHEQLEANLKAANLGGIIDPQETMNALARVADALPVAAAQQRLAALERRKAPQSHIEEARRELDLRQRIQSIASGEGDEAAMREIAVELAVANVIAHDKSGMKTGFQAGTISTALDSAIESATSPREIRALGKFRAFLRSVRAWVRSVLGTVAGFQKARRDGKLTDGDAWNAWLDKVTGVTEQARYDQELADEIKAIAGQDEAQYSGPGEGMAFSLSRVTPAQDAEYMRAVESGDMAMAQRMVDEAARDAGYDIEAWHSTFSKPFTEFDMQMAGTSTGGWLPVRGMFFSNNKNHDSHLPKNREGLRVGRFYLSLKSPLSVRNYSEVDARLGDDFDQRPDDGLARLKELNNDSIIIGGGDEIIATSPNQIKSADPVTRDESGNIIPLSQRFNPADNRITFSLSPARSIESESFKTWFKDSKAIDSKGAPLVVYHGAPDVRGIFAEGFKGFSRGMVFFATDSERKANTYADDRRAFDYQNAEPGVIPLYLSIQNPLIIDAKGANWKDTQKHVTEAKLAGHDGIIIKNVVDDYQTTKDSKPGTVYAWFDPTQAKSALSSQMRSRIDGVAIAGAMPNNGGFSPDDPRISFSVSPARNLELVQSAIDSQLSRDPDKRLKLAASAMQKLEALRQRWMEEGWTALGHYKRPLVEKRSKASLDKEQAMRQATRERELLDLGMNSLSQQQAETYYNGVQKLEDHPLVSAMLNDQGRLMSKTTAIAQGKLKTDGKGNAGDYDTAPWLPPSWYRNGGGIMPDAMAQALYDDGKLNDSTPDALWSALSSVIESQRKAKASFDEAAAAVREISKQANEQARSEAQAWRDEQDAMQSKDWNPRAALVRDLQLLDSVLSVMPPEVRGKVGGFVKLAQLATEDARVNELQRRVSRMDTLLEDYLAKEYRERIDKLLERAAPKMKPGEKPKGSMAADAHRLVKLVRESMAVSEEAMDERRAAIEKAMAEDAANMPDLLERAQVLEMFGGFDKLPASELAVAHDWLAGVVASGRNRWKMVEEARLAEQKARAKQLKDDTGKSGDPVELQNAIEAEKTLAKTGVGLGFSLISFPQTVRSLFGDKSQAGQRLIDMARRATSARTDAIIQRRAEFKAAMRSIFGTTDQAKIDAAMWEHSQVTGKLGVTVKWSELTTKSERVPRDVVERMMEDRSIAKALGFTTNEVDELERAWLDSENDGKSVFILDRMTEGPAKDLNLSQMQAIHLLMMATQKPETLARHGYTADVLDEIEGKLTNEAKSIRAWLLGRYRDGYQPLNAVFQRMYGAPLPQISGYSPMTFEGMQDGGMLTPEGGSQGFGGMSPGALKTRRNHNAKPRLEDALAVYWSHAIQTEHFIHFAEPVRDMRSTLLQPDTRAAVQVKAGVEGLNALKNWVHIFENDGMRKAGALTAIERLSSKLQSAVSVSALAWNVGTMVKQSLAALGALYKMPTRAYLRGLSRVLSGKIDIRPMFESAIIRRRVEAGATPELRQVMAGYMAEHPGKWSRRPREFVNYGMELLGKTDGFFTAISAAIYHDHISNEMKASGMGEAEASALAMRETEAMIGDTAQPVELMDRSLFEAGNAASPNARWLFMFASESRQKTALYGVALHRIATGRGTKQDARVVLVSHVIAPLILQTITNIIRDARSDDDDEAFDMETWSPMRYLQAMAMGPLSGLPLIQEASNPMLDMIQRSYYGIKGLFDDRKDAEPIEKGTKAAKAALNAVSLASIFPGLKPLEWLGAGANGVGQLFDWLDNLQGKDKRSGK